MTDQELQLLAREYAEQYPPFSDPDLTKADRNSMVETMTDYAVEILRWLTKTHCIVSREKVMEEYDVAVLLQHSNQISDQDTGTVRQTLFEYIFGKSTFEERSKQ